MAGTQPKVHDHLLRRDVPGMIIVGPEGDFTNAEKQQMLEAGALAAGLGPLRLRVETAAIAALATLMLL